MIVIEFRGKVIPKNDPRHVVRNNIAWAYVSEGERVYAEALRYAASEKMKAARKPPLEGPVMVDMTIYVIPPAYLSKLKRRRALAGLLFPDKRPDLSNYIKMVEDALTGVVWVDDKQVVSLMARKRFGEIPGVRVEIEEVRDDNVQYS